MAIASCLIDTSILLRIARRSDPQHKVVDTALAQLIGQGTTLHYTHQNIAELWNAMTRPINRNGLGLTLPDSEAVYREWRRIVVQYSVSGVQAHDARLAAAMYVHRVGHVLTLNISDFSRSKGLIAVDPVTVGPSI